jgi:glycosyltransferase involved in cell wall biosynthesis
MPSSPCPRKPSTCCKHFDLDPHKIHVIHNGIDLDEYHRVEAPDVLRKHGVDPDQPYVLFVGRITRQKGIIHLVRAIQHLDPGFQIVLCAGAPDTPEIKAEMEAAVAAEQCQTSRHRVDSVHAARAGKDRHVLACRRVLLPVDL